MEPVSPRAELDSARTALARALELESAGSFHEAFHAFRRATELDPNCGRAWRHLGNLLRRTGELGLACECFEKAIASGDDRRLNEFFLSAIGIGAVVTAPPAAFVTALFDQYAERFDRHLQQLNYRAPRMLSDLVSQSATRPYEAVLDLGCGSGLTGRQFVDKSRRITGVDLSREMLSRAGLLGIYDRLVESDLETHLWNTDERYDLVLCCDVFIYLGDLSGVFAGVHRVLQAGGSFAFTIEPCDADSGYDLLPTLRYAHSESYIRRLATEFKFHVRGIAEGALRDEDHRSVEGLAVHLERAQPEP